MYFLLKMGLFQCHVSFQGWLMFRPTLKCSIYPEKVIFYPIVFWVVVSNIFYVHPYLGKIPILTNIFQMGWNHQLVFQSVFWLVGSPYAEHISWSGTSLSDENLFHFLGRGIVQHIEMTSLGQLMIAPPEMPTKKKTNWLEGLPFISRFYELVVNLHEVILKGVKYHVFVPNYFGIRSLYQPFLLGFYAWFLIFPMIFPCFSHNLAFSLGFPITIFLVFPCFPMFAIISGHPARRALSLTSMYLGRCLFGKEFL